MANICHKKSAALMWTLLECVFFSGVVLGWSWLALIFRSDGYFSCNITVLSSASFQTSVVTALNSGDVKQRGKNCRSKAVHSRAVREPPFNNSTLLTTHISSVSIPEVSPVAEQTTRSFQSLSPRPPEPEEESDLCVGQREMLRVLFAVVAVLRDLLVLPIGASFDKYGTTRTRLLTVLVFAIGTLMTTFTTDSVPWLMVPALSLTGVAGTAVLLTNLQVANLFGRRRHLVVALYCGASLSSGLITYMMQLSHSQDVNVQTSFMFLTIGLVPMLVSTVAFLPKTRVPWPLPANYGKRRNQSLDENMLRKQRAWQRRLSEAGVVKLRRPLAPFWPRAVQHQLLLAGAVVWHGVQALHTADMETRLVDIGHLTDGFHSDLEHVFGWLQLLGVALAPLPGLLIDRRRPPQLGVPPGTQQMQNIVPAILLTSLLAVFERVLSMFAGVACQVSSFILHALHRVFHLTTTFSFLVHVHFPQEHIGKYTGLTLAISAVFTAFQFPIRIYFHNREHQPMHAHILLLVLLVFTLSHALNVWICCRRRLIRDQPDRLSDRAHRSGPSTSGHASLAVHIETDDSNMPPNYRLQAENRSDSEEDLELQHFNRNGGPHVIITEPDAAPDLET